MSAEQTLRDGVSKLSVDYESGRLFADLVNGPVPHPKQQAPVLLKAITRRGMERVDAAYTVVMPVFEQESRLRRNLDLIETHATLVHDFIFIDDGSADGSASVISEFIDDHPSKLIRTAVLLRNHAPIFETACDNLGFMLADTDAVIEIQADLQIAEKSFDAMMVRTLADFPNASSVSGRAGHCFILKQPTGIQRLFGFQHRQSVGLMGSQIENAGIVDSLRGFVYECETVNRGPWALRRSDLQRYGFLDQANFFLGDDDHDFHRRLFQTEERSPLYLPMKVTSALEEGATRRPRSALNAEVYAYLKAHRKHSAGYVAFLAQRRRPRPVRAIAVPSLSASAPAGPAFEPA